MLIKRTLNSISKWKLPTTIQTIQNNFLSEPQSFFNQSIISSNNFTRQHQFQRFFTKKVVSTEKTDKNQAAKPETKIYDAKQQKEYELKCEQGDTKAIIEYATSLLDGTHGLKRDSPKAAHYFKIGSEKGDTECMFMYAICLFYGEGVKTDFPTAFSLFKETADRGKLDSEFYLYLSFMDGKGVDKDEDEAIRYLKKSADNGFPSSCTTLAMRLPDDDPKKYEYLKKAAELGESNGEYLYGISLVDSKDVKNGLFYIKKSADEGNHIAQQAYGNFLFNGEHVEKDVKLAAHYFSLSARQNNPAGCYGYSHALMMQEKVDKQKVFEVMQKAADLGHIEAMIELSEMILDDYVKIKGDPNKEALKYIQKAVDNGSSIAMIMYALMAENGAGFDKPEPEIAGEYFKKAVDLSESGYAYRYYTDYLRRHEKVDEMDKYLELGAKAGDDQCEFNYGLDLHLKEKDDESMKYLKSSAEKGNVDAMNLLASIVIGKDPEEAMKLLKEAIERGCLPAMFNYANYAYNNKFPALKDAKKEAFHYMKMAADQHLELAVKAVANWLFMGDCCEKNVDEALKYFKESADFFNDPESQYVVAYILTDCFKSASNEGIDYLRKSADQNFDRALHTLGILHLNGNFVKQDDQKALNYFKRAADLGFADSMNSYALCLFNGRGIEKNEKEAAKYFKKAADAGSVDSMYNLGIMYMSGNGVEKDKEKGEKYLKMANQNGFEHALEIGEHIYNQEDDEEIASPVKDNHSIFLKI